MLQLRDYQQEMIDKVIESLRMGYRKIMIVLPTGGGKTAIASELVRRSYEKNKSSIFMCHRQELLDQAYETYGKNGIIPAFIKGGRHPDYKNPMQIASVNTLVRRLNQYNVPDIVFVDECFSGNTNILTENGYKYIKDIKIDEMVYCFNEETKNIELKPVKNVISKEIKQKLCEITINGKKIYCTENHLFFTKKGWTKAKDLCIFDMVLNIINKKGKKNGSKVRKMWQFSDFNKIKEGTYKKNRNDTVSRMYKRTSETNIFQNNGGNESEICFGTNEEKQSYEKSNNSRKSVNNASFNAMETKNTWWKWLWSNTCSNVNCISFRMGYGICSKNKSLQRWKWLSDKLQNRYCKSCFKNWDRSGWFFSLLSYHTKSRCKENRLFDWARVDNIEIQKSRNIGKFRKLLRENKVYDLTVEDNHNYFAEGVLVHNCHHAKASQWNAVLDWAKNSVVVGLTATPCRLDGKPLNDMFEKMIQVIDVKSLINRGYLVPYLYYAPSIIDTSELEVSNGDYTKKSLENASFNSKIIGDNIEQYKKIADGKRNVVFAISRKHGFGICERYNNAGIRAEFLDGESSDKDRKATLDRFRSGETKVLVNVDLFGEGFDLPAIEVVSLLRPTQSTSLYLQQVGRALRTCPELGKTKAIILDHVNNYKTHGMPDEKREWSLSTPYKARVKRNEESVVHIKRCPKCFFAHEPALVCPNCGYHYEADGKTIKEIAGELTLIGSDDYNALLKKEVIVAKSLDDLVKIEKDRNYKFGWAELQYQRKTGQNLKSSLEGYEEIAKARGYNQSWAWVQWNRVRRGF